MEISVEKVSKVYDKKERTLNCYAVAEGKEDFDLSQLIGKPISVAFSELPARKSEELNISPKQESTSDLFVLYAADIGGLYLGLASESNWQSQAISEGASSACLVVKSDDIAALEKVFEEFKGRKTPKLINYLNKTSPAYDYAASNKNIFSEVETLAEGTSLETVIPKQIKFKTRTPWQRYPHNKIKAKALTCIDFVYFGLVGNYILSNKGIMHLSFLNGATISYDEELEDEYTNLLE